MRSTSYLSPLSVVKKTGERTSAEVAVMFNPLAAGLSWAASIPEDGTRGPRGRSSARDSAGSAA